jgi:uncharacterized membrane protein
MTDEQLDVIIARILRTGVSVSAATVLTGGIWHLADSGGEAVPYGHYSGNGGIRALLALPAPEIVILAGLLMLIATPVARVAFSLAAFAIQRDRMYVVFTAIVLAVLVYSILVGL